MPSFDLEAADLFTDGCDCLGQVRKSTAVFVEDGLNKVVIRSGLPADGYLVLLDTYNPDWHVDVDGSPAVLMRGNGLFRAVHVARGNHVVTFSYHSGKFRAGASIV